MISQAKIRGFLAENRTFAEEKRIENVQCRTRLSVYQAVQATAMVA